MERIQVKAFIGNKSPNIQVKTCGETWRSWRLRVQESERIEGTKNSQWSKKCWSVQYNSWAAKQVFLLCLCLLSFSEEKICLGKATVVRNVRKWSKSPRVEAKERRRRQVKWVWNELKSLKCAKKRVQKGVWILSWQYLAVLLYYLVLSCIILYLFILFHVFFRNPGATLCQSCHQILLLGSNHRDEFSTNLRAGPAASNTEVVCCLLFAHVGHVGHVGHVIVI